MPPGDSLRLEEVWIVSVARPYSTSCWTREVSLLYEDVLLKTSLVGLVSLTGSNCDGIVDDWDKESTVLSDLNNLRSEGGVSLIRDCKDLVVIHIVNISPHCVQGDVELSIVLIDIPPDGVVLVAELALIPSEGPHGRNGLVASYLLILLDRIFNSLGGLEEDLVDKASHCNAGYSSQALAVNVSVEEVVCGVC